MSIGAVDDPEPPAGLAGLSLFPPPPEHETHATTESGMSTPVASPQYQGAINDVTKIGADQAETLSNKGDLESATAESVADQASNTLDAFDKMRAAKTAEDAKQTALIKQQADILKQANDELKNTPSPSLFHKGDTWANVAKAVALAVGSFGDALAAKGASLGGRSSNQNSVRDIINLAVETEKDHIAKLKDNQLIAQTGVKDALVARETALARIDMAGSEAAKRAQLLGDYMVKAAGPQAAIYQARLDALNLAADQAKFKASSLASLNQTATARNTTEEIKRDEKAPKAGVGPATNFDSGGEHYNVDATQTTTRGQTIARGQLGLIQGAIKNGEEALAAVPAEAPTNLGYFTGDTKRADVDAKISSLRNAAGAALKESMGQQAGDERAAQIFPSVPLTDHGMPQWRAKVQAGLETMKVLKAEALHAAGAHEAGATADRTVPAATKPPAPAAPAAHPLDAEAIKFAKAHPTDPRSARILQLNGLAP